MRLSWFIRQLAHMRSFADVKKALTQPLYERSVLLRKIPKNSLCFKQGRLYSKEELLDMLPKGSVGVEIGVWQGKFSKEILSRVQPRCLHLVDPWMFLPEYPHEWAGGRLAKSQEDMDQIFEEVRTYMAQEVGQDKVRIWRMTSEAFFKSFTDKVDWVYIDGDHFYDGVLTDLNGASSLIKQGGIIWGDDLRWQYPGQSNLPVQEAVIKFCSENKRKYASFSGQYIIL